MVTFTTKDGKRVSFKAKSRPKSKPKSKARGKTSLTRAQRAKLSRAAKKRPRYKTGPKKGQFKKVRK